MKLKTYLFVTIMMIAILSIAVAFIEIYEIYQNEQKINQIQNNINLLNNVIEANNHYDILKWIFWGSGVNVEAERGNNIKLDRLGTYSITLNWNLQKNEVEMCENTNRVSRFTNVSIDCFLVGSNGLPDTNELNKLEVVRGVINQQKVEFENKNNDIELSNKIWKNIRNFLYIFLIVVTGISSILSQVIELKPKSFK